MFFHRSFRSLASLASHSLIVALLALFASCAPSVPAGVRAEMAKTPPGVVTVVEFVDFECPYCRRMHEVTSRPLKDNAARVRIVRKQVPLSIHPHAESAARAYLCGTELGARQEDLADALFTVSPENLAETPAISLAVAAGARADGMEECVHDAHILARLREDGRAFGDANGEGVPLTFVGKTRLDGAVDEETFANVLHEEMGHVGRRAASSAPPVAGGPLSAARVASASVSAAPGTVARSASTVTFIEDDYPRALAEAKAQNVPIFVDAWAPWCHSCLSMRSFTLSSPKLAPLADKLVWLAIDTEKPENAAFVSKYPNDVWPTLYVIDASDERARVKWGGTATADELTLFLSDVLEPNVATDDAMLAFTRGNAARAAGDLSRAESEYHDALAKATPGFRERARAVEALTMVVSDEEKLQECIDLAKKEVPSLPQGSSRATVLATGIECASESKQAPGDLLTWARADLAAQSDARLVDDTSALFDSVVETLQKQGDLAGARTEAERWVALLDAAAAHAQTPAARSVFDAHRLLAYAAAGREMDAVPVLTQSQKDFPDDYNPPARLAKVYFDTRDYERARANIDVAFAKVYGPRTMRIASLGALISKAQQKPKDAAAFLHTAIARVKPLPLTVKQRRALDQLQRDLADLERDPREIKHAGAP